MMINPVYLDANATEPVRDRSINAVIDGLKQVGNPSSVHALGRRCYHMIEDCREIMVDLFGGDVQNCIFTSGGTEADILAIYGQIEQRPLWVGATEHPAILQIDIDKMILPVNVKGQLDLQFLEHHLQLAKIPPLVALMLANNETGVIHPIQRAAELCKQYGALLHVDAVQAAGRIRFKLEDLGADSLALSAHKMGGSKGVGALLLAAQHRGAKRLNPVFVGGGQEQGRRGGTQALPMVVGMTAAAQEACSEDRSSILALRNFIEKEVKLCGAIICGEGAERLDNTSCIAFPGLPAQRQLMALDMAGFCVSTGSACSSGKVAKSYVLSAMGLETLSDCAIRVSLPWNVQSKDVELFVQAYRSMVS